MFHKKRIFLTGSVTANTGEKHSNFTHVATGGHRKMFRGSAETTEPLIQITYNCSSLSGGQTKRRWTTSTFCPKQRREKL